MPGTRPLSGSARRCARRSMGPRGYKRELRSDRAPRPAKRIGWRIRASWPVRYGASSRCAKTGTGHSTSSAASDPTWSKCPWVSTMAAGGAVEPTNAAAADRIASAYPGRPASTRTHELAVLTMYTFDRRGCVRTEHVLGDFPRLVVHRASRRMPVVQATYLPDGQPPGYSKADLADLCSAVAGTRAIDADVDAAHPPGAAAGKGNGHCCQPGLASTATAAARSSTVTRA